MSPSNISFDLVCLIYLYLYHFYTISIVIQFCMRFHCICACDLTVIHILYHSSPLMSLPPKFHCSPVQLFCTGLLPMILLLLLSYFRRKKSNSILIYDPNHSQKVCLPKILKIIKQFSILSQPLMMT